MPGVTSKQFLEEFQATEKSFARLRTFLRHGGPKQVLEDEILILIKHTIGLRWTAMLEADESFEPKQ